MLYRFCLLKVLPWSLPLAKTVQALLRLKGLTSLSLAWGAGFAAPKASLISKNLCQFTGLRALHLKRAISTKPQNVAPAPAFQPAAVPDYISRLVRLEQLRLEDCQVCPDISGAQCAQSQKGGGSFTCARPAQVSEIIQVGLQRQIGESYHWKQLLCTVISRDMYCHVS